MLALALALLAACSDSDPQNGNGSNTNAAPADVVAEIPASLAPFGDGYPNPGDPCRILGESDTTRNWLDDSATLVGCPTEASAAALQGEKLDTIDGVIVLSIPSAQSAGRPVEEMPDELVPGTNFHATTQIPCSIDGGKTSAICDAGVVRAQTDDSLSTVEITKPDGSKRIISFQDTNAVGGDGSEADGAAGYSFKATRQEDETLIEYGPERYTIPDALVIGG